MKRSNIASYPLSDKPWRFRFETDSSWQTVTLPHTWNATDTMDTNLERHYHRGTGIYELNFEPPEDADGQRLWVKFDAVAQRSKVYFEDNLLTEHHGGYTAFIVEVPNRAGTLRVEANNTPDPDLIPSDMSDFFLYGGITRDVLLFATRDTRLTEMFFDIDTTDERATLRLCGRLYDTPESPLNLNITLFDQMKESQVFATLFTVTERDFKFELPDVINPHLWSPDDPNLYTVHVMLSHDGIPLDHLTGNLGFRYFDFPENDVFYLNGERLLLQGTHRHEDWAGYGGAVPQHIVRQEFQQIKDAGFNFVRLGHYPQGDFVLDLCDQLGLIVWDELPWCRGGVGEETFKQYARAMLREMIEQHYNHPSVVFCGLGNELDWESEHVNSTEAYVIDFLRELQAQTRQLDPTRLTAVRRFEPAKDIVDVVSPSIWSGWYRGRYEDYEIALKNELAHYPRLLHIEWGGDSHVGRHNNGPHILTDIETTTDHGEVPGTATSSEGFSRYSKDGDWSESYIIDLMAHHLTVQARMSELAGYAQWVFKDFGTPLRPENPVPYVNQKGLITRDGTPKDAYYVFKAFQIQSALVHIESSGWDTRIGDNSQPQAIRVITNCEQVELFVNNESQGIKQVPTSPAGIVGWNALLSVGNNSIKANGIVGNMIKAQHEITAQFAIGNCASVAGFNAYVDLNDQNTRVVCQLIDNDGYPVTNDERRVRFSTTPASTLYTNKGFMGGSDVIETANGRAWINVNAPSDGEIFVQVDGLGTKTVRLN